MAKAKQRKIIKAGLAEKMYAKLTSLRFTIGSNVFELDLGDELIISDDVSKDVERLPATMGYFGTIISMLDNEHKTKEDLKKKLEAEIDKDVRKGGLTGETRIDRAIKRDPRWIEACVAVNKAKEQFDKSRYFWQALREKGQAMQIRAADIRNIPSDSIYGVSKRSLIKGQVRSSNKE